MIDMQGDDADGISSVMGKLNMKNNSKFSFVLLANREIK